MGCAIHSLAALIAAASALTAAELPAHVPTYHGDKPAPKELPAGIPAYHGQPGATMHSPHLTRPRMNAPRPGVALPGDVPETKGRSEAEHKPKDGGGKATVYPPRTEAGHRS